MRQYHHDGIEKLACWVMFAGGFTGILFACEGFIARSKSVTVQVFPNIVYWRVLGHEVSGKIWCPCGRPMIETVPLEEASDAYSRMMQGKARFRSWSCVNNGQSLLQQGLLSCDTLL